MADYHFQPGNNESKGRPPGSANKRSNELWNRLKNRGDVDPADYCSSIVSNPNESTELKLAAANYLLPYLYSKRGAIPPPRYIELEIDVNEFTHVSDAENFLAKIALLVARGHLDIQSGQELSALVEAWIRTQYAKDELAYKISPPETRDAVIRIEGGLPKLPGCENLIMPTLDHEPVPQIEAGKNSATNGHGPSSSANEFLQPPNEFVQVDPETKDQGLKGGTPGAG
jgi:hypothetical protein